jgi:hypothetical protein
VAPGPAQRSVEFGVAIAIALFALVIIVGSIQAHAFIPPHLAKAVRIEFLGGTEERSTPKPRPIQRLQGRFDLK